jgi:hypothetical protein
MLPTTKSLAPKWLIETHAPKRRTVKVLYHTQHFLSRKGKGRLTGETALCSKLLLPNHFSQGPSQHLGGAEGFLHGILIATDFY